MRARLVALLVALLLIVAGSAMLGAASQAPAFDERGFDAELIQLRQGDNAGYAALYARYVGARYRLPDLAGSVLALGIGVLVAAWRPRWVLTTPRGRAGLKFAIVLPPVLLTVAALAETLVHYARRDYPPWADSLGAFYFAIFIMGAIAMLLMLPHLWLVPRRHVPRVSLSAAFAPPVNPWLAGMGVLAVGLTAALLYDGAWRSAIAQATFAYAFFALAAARHAARQEAPTPVLASPDRHARP